MEATMASIGGVIHSELTAQRAPRTADALVLVAILVTSPGHVLGQSAGAVTVKDAGVDQSKGLVPLGGEQYMTVGGPQSQGGDTRALIRFDVSGYPTANAVSEAVLYIYQINAQSYNINVHRVTEPWDEKTATWSTRDGVTPWLNPAGGGTFDSAMVTGSFPANSIGWRAVAIDPTLVQNWLTGAWPNYGLLLDVPGDQLFVPVKFETRESHNRPYLHVRYNVAPEGIRVPDLDVHGSAVLPPDGVRPRETKQASRKPM
jgi:hypothetical protein